MKKPLLTIFKIYLSAIIVAILSRAIFLITHLSLTLTLPLGTALRTFFSGLTLDLSTAGYITAIPMVLMIFGVWCGDKIPDKIWRIALRSYLILIALATALITAVDANLYSYWGYRIDATLLPYLATPSEAAASLTFADVAITSTIFIVIACTAIWLYWRAVAGLKFTSMKLTQRAVWTPLTILIAGFIFLAIRGGVTASVANVSKVYFSDIQYANHAAVNPLFSLLSSVGRLEDFDNMYHFYSPEDLERHLVDVRGSQQGTPRPILTTQRPNVAIVICESYNRAIMDLEVEGRPVMPNLRRIAAEGVDFTKAYATGARTDRGVATTLSGFPSQPKISIMKIPAKSRNLPSIARSLGREGYTSQFYYGGDLNFMDMSSYLYSTGWERLIWQYDIQSPNEAPRNWGYSDGVTMQLFADEIERLDALDTPFLASLLTLSSHEPYDVPEDMGIKDKILNAVAYSDAKLGAMIDQLKASPAWDNLLVVIVADHSSSFPYGLAYNSPVRYHIPLIFSGGALRESGVESDFISQMDIAATLLAQMGIDHSDFEFSRDHFDTSRTTPRYGYFTFSDGVCVVDEEEAIIYLNNLDRVALSTHGRTDIEICLDDNTPLTPSQLHKLQIGKATLQRTHEAIGGM